MNWTGHAYPRRSLCLLFILLILSVMDLRAQAFVSVGNMTRSHIWHTATLLQDGRVLIAGGDTATAEIYDPLSGTFAVTGSMSVSRGGHAAVLLPMAAFSLSADADARALNSTIQRLGRLRGREIVLLLCCALPLFGSRMERCWSAT